MTKDSLSITDEDKNKIEFQVNPAEVEKKLAIQYNTSAPLGSIGDSTRYVKHQPEELKFKTIFDGTGVLEKSKCVRTQMSTLDKIIYNYNGDKHEPNVVTIRWGKESFKGRLRSMKRKYTLYSPEGEPLRVELTFVFVRFMSASEQTNLSNRSSPDLTHIIEVKAGDTLPALCLKIYRDANYYNQIARINRLHNFRELKPGTQLIFPPLVQ